MFAVNFKEAIEVAGILQPKQEKISEQLFKIGVFAQCIESQLWEGHPYVVSNVRLLLEELANLILMEAHFTIEIDEEKGKTKDELREEYTLLLNEARKRCGQSNIVQEAFGNKTILIKNKNEFPLYIKLLAVESIFEELGHSTKAWNFKRMRDDANIATHHINLLQHYGNMSITDCFYQLFEYQRQIHATIYKAYIESHSPVGYRKIPDYHMPTKEDLELIVERYISQLKIFGVEEDFLMNSRMISY